MSSHVVRPDRQALLELDALVTQIERLRDAGSPERFWDDNTYRWALHRLWICAGNEAAHYADARGRNVNDLKPWGALYRLRNRLAHLRLPDIDDNEVWRYTVIQPDRYRRALRDLLN